MSDVEQKLLVLSPEADDHIPEAVLLKADCGCRCWISPESLTLALNDPLVTTKCLTCAGINLQDMEALGAAGRVYEVPGQREALRKHLTDEQIEEVYRRLGIRTMKPPL